MKILIADDNKFIRVATKKVLSQNYPHAEIEEACSFHELLFKISTNKNQWSCIVSDIHCWGFSAIEIEQKAGRLKNIPVIITTTVPLESYQKILSVENISSYVMIDKIQEELPSSLQRILAGEQLLQNCLLKKSKAA